MPKILFSFRMTKNTYENVELSPIDSPIRISSTRKISSLRTQTLEETESRGMPNIRNFRRERISFLSREKKKRDDRVATTIR